MTITPVYRKAQHFGGVRDFRCWWYERFAVVGDRVVVFIHVRVRLKHETEWREGRTVDVFTFRHGKAIEFRTFADEQQALEWAGVKAPDAE